MRFLSSPVAFLIHNPLLALAFLLWIIFGWSSSYVLLKLVRAGYASDLFGTGRMIVILPQAYLRTRNANGWPAWPAYLVWISAMGGFASFAAGLFRFIA